MFSEDVIRVLDAIIEHTVNNDIRFQARKLRQKVKLKRFTSLSDSEQRKTFFQVVEQVRLGYDTMKEVKHVATDTIYRVIRDKLGEC